LKNAVKEAIAWLDSHHDSCKEEYEAKQKEVEKVCMPIITKIYQATGAQPGGMPDFGAPSPDFGDHKSSGKGPKIEEVD
jgi:L1 cell adhesion molecule like protein